MIDAFWTELVKQAAVVAAGAIAAYGVKVGKDNGRKADQAVINTNGHLSDLREELKKTRDELAGAHQTITTLSTILSAQRVAPIAGPGIPGTSDAAPVSVRKTDIAPALPNAPAEKS